MDAPDVPVRSRRSSQRRSIHAANAAANPYSRRNSGVASGPDVINNLISSLSIISEPASSHFESQPSASAYSTAPHPDFPPASSPKPSGSFGVEYGSSSKSADEPRNEPISLDEIAASAPIVRTSKTPSRISSSTVKSPRSSSHDSGSGLASYMRGGTHSRPSSRGSTGSRNDDSRSIGNLSIERGSAPTPELRPRRSHDSWGRKNSRSHKNVNYMSSKERLRDRDYDRKWPQPSGKTSSIGGSSIHSSSRGGDPFLAETAIREEPGIINDAANGQYENEYAHPIPSRDSSLRKPGHRKQRSSARRSARNSEDAIGAPIFEADEIGRATSSSQQGHRRSNSDNARRLLFNVEEYGTPTRGRSEQLYESHEEFERQRRYAEDINEEGAPFPAISSGRKRWERSMERSSSRLSGRLSPNPASDELGPKRSSSKLKRLSGQLSPRSEPRTREPSVERRNLPMGYERPGSADSVDDAVESYLCSPRLSQKIKHPQTGRVISFSEVGDPEGSAVFCCVGMGLTRYITAFYDELALTLRLRLITPDRPGVGDSEPYTDGSTTPLGWPGKLPHAPLNMGIHRLTRNQTMCTLSVKP